jgi:hypothetical protein
MAETKLVRRKQGILAIHYEKIGDHTHEYVYSVGTGQVVTPETIANFSPEEIEYAMFMGMPPFWDKRRTDIPNCAYRPIKLGDWLLELNGEIIGVFSPEELIAKFDDYIQE